jgi:hypothetical protein
MRRDSGRRLLCRDVHSDELQRSQVASPTIYISLQFLPANKLPLSHRHLRGRHLNKWKS